MAGITALLVLALAVGASAQGFPGSFNHGVASGDPLADRIILWTRVTPREANSTKLASLKIPVKWAVFKNEDLQGAPVAQGRVQASADTDFTVKVDAKGLQAGAKYYYAFFLNEGAIRSPIGQFRLPRAAGQRQQNLRYAIFSCSNWGWGYFNAYDAATRYDLDFWMHLGDYIYEYGVDDYPNPSEAVRYQEAPLGLQPPHELFTLDDYRTRHALYRQDPGLQGLAASAAMIAAWDDHEIANDAWTNGAQNHQPNEGDYQARKMAAVKAYHEWNPTRPKPSNPIEFYRSFQFGDLATLVMLETRLTDRTSTTPGGALGNVFGAVGAIGFPALPPNQWTADMIAAAQKLAADGNKESQKPNKTILGPKQLRYIRTATRNSIARGTTWQLYGQDTVMLGQLPPDFEAAIQSAPSPAKKRQWQSALTNLTDDIKTHTTTIYTKYPQWSYLRGAILPVTDAMKAAARVILAMGRYKINFNFDSWMGYQVEKQRFLKAISGGAADAGQPKKLNAVIYGGDSHNAWAGVQKLGGSPVATEFDGQGVTSPGFENSFGFIPLDLLASGFLANNPDLTFSNIEEKGFMLVELTQQKHHVDFLKVEVGSQQYKLGCLASFEVQRGKQEVKSVPCSNPPNGVPYAAARRLLDSVAQSSSALP